MFNKPTDITNNNVGEMSDNEIVKALTICSITGASCKDYPAFVKDGRSKCKKVLIGALDIIDRLQVQNNDLTETVHNMKIYKTIFKKKNPINKRR